MTEPRHGRKLVLSAVALVPGKVRHSAAAASEVRELVEAIMVRSAFLDRAPFSWVGLMLRYGKRNQESPEYDEVDPEDGELPVAIELDMNDLQKASKEDVQRHFLGATLRSLIDVGRRFDLPTAALEEAMAAAKRTNVAEDSRRNS